jgi:hypothetical protein
VKTTARKITLGAIIGAAIGAIILFFFGDGFAMAFYLAAEGIILGGLVGGVIVFSLVLCRVCPAKQHDAPNKSFGRESR